MGVLKTNLEGKRVYHINFGEGVIKSQTIRDDQDTDIIFVEYLNGETKKHRYPTIFTDFLKMIDDKDDAIIQRDISEFKKKESAKKSEHMPAQVDNTSWRAAEYSNKRQNTKIIDIDKGHRYSTKNVAFKCTYNDGGKDKNGIGFSYICSDEQIRRNIKDGRAWCCNESCACKEYYDGVISRQELDSINDNGGWVCYESVMLIEWKAQAGERNVNATQKPVTIKIRNAYKDSLAILTTRIPGSPEQERIIFGLFIIADYYEGDEDTAGYVSAHSKYRLVFSAEQGRRLKFWKYHANEKSPSKTIWRTGLIRNISEDEGVQILRDAVSLKTGTKDEKLAKEFFHYYCDQNYLNSDSIGEPEGALTLSHFKG